MSGSMPEILDTEENKTWALPSRSLRVTEEVRRITAIATAGSPILTDLRSGHTSGCDLQGGKVSQRRGHLSSVRKTEEMGSL